jgi:osmotically-inducible protein OsmY
MRTNEQLQRDVMAEILNDSELKTIAPEIGVSAKDGVITLSGVVDHYSQKLAAERAAQRVKGVRVLAVDLKVITPSAIIRTDPQLALAVRSALMCNTHINSETIEIKVENGWIFLNGVVDWKFQKHMAERLIEVLPGVRGITNYMRVKSTTIDCKGIKRKIGAAFHHNATLDAATIRVEVSGSTVTLRGTVQSWFEKEEAERVAWASPGVLKVDNHIFIDTEVYV